MSGLDEPGTTVDEPVRQRSVGSRLGDLGDRLARTFASLDEPRADSSTHGSNGAPEVSTAAETQPSGPGPATTRFPIARRGYDHTAVDQHVAELERELAELRAGSPSVTAEIERIGEHTAAILTLAHEKAQETTRVAQAQADSCLSNAAANAIAITEDAKRQLSEIDSETDSVWRERARLIEDVRSVAMALISLADDASERFAAEPERGDPPTGEFSAAPPNGEFSAAPATEEFAAPPPPPVFAPEQPD